MYKYRSKKQIAHAEYMRNWRKNASQDSLDLQRRLSKEWHSKHPDKVKAYKHEWYIRNRKRVKEKARSPERIAWEAAYKKSESGKAAKKRAKHKRRGVEVNTLTAAQWVSIRNAFDNKCAYCGSARKKLEQDHVVPISRGGGHELMNVVPACRKCNHTKYTRTAEEWIGKGKANALIRNLRTLKN